MALRLVKNTGDDTTGDGTLGNPFLTIQRALGAGYVKGNKIGLLSAITISTTILLPANTSYVYTVITGVNDAGVEDGTRRTISGGGTTGFAFASSNMSLDCHAFRISNIDFAGFTLYILQNAGFFSRTIFSNYSVTGGRGVDGGGVGHALMVHEDFTVTGVTGAAPVFVSMGASSVIRRGVIKDSTFASAYIFTTSNTPIENIVITNCVLASGIAYSFLYGTTTLRNIIVDRCAIAGLNSALFNDSSYENVLLTNITFTGTGTKTLFLAYDTAVQLNNIRLFNIAGNTAIAAGRTATQSVSSKNVSTLTESPYVNDDGNDYTLKTNYNGRRLAGVNLGEYTGLWNGGAI